MVEPGRGERGDGTGPAVGGDLQGDPAAEGVADDVDAVEAERVEQAFDPGGEPSR